MALFIHQLKGWPKFIWNHEGLTGLLAEVRHKQGYLMGRMKNLGFHQKSEATLNTLTIDVIKTSEIEGEILPADQVRSSIARKLGLDFPGMVPSDRFVEGVVEMMLDATQKSIDPVTENRLFSWHAALFPTGYSGMHKIVVGEWRNNPPEDPMQVLSGAMGIEKVHFQAPASELLTDEMEAFIHWFNTENRLDSILKAAIAHLWLITIHPFDDGNGRIARALTDMLLTRSDGSNFRFYSMSAQIRKERNAYYHILEQTQKGSLDISEWLEWFFNCLKRALETTDETIGNVLQKSVFWNKHKDTSLNDRQKLMLNKLLDGFEGKLNSSKWAKINKCSTDTALSDINDLMQKEILAKQIGGGRSTSYLLVE